MAWGGRILQWGFWFSINLLSIKFLVTQPCDLMNVLICITISEDKRYRTKSSSRFSEARKRGRTMLYHLTSQFSRGGKAEVNLRRVSVFITYFLLSWMGVLTNTSTYLNKITSQESFLGLNFKWWYPKDYLLERQYEEILTQILRECFRWKCNHIALVFTRMI